MAVMAHVHEAVESNLSQDDAEAFDSGMIWPKCLSWKAPSSLDDEIDDAATVTNSKNMNDSNIKANSNSPTIFPLSLATPLA